MTATKSGAEKHSTAYASVEHVENHPPLENVASVVTFTVIYQDIPDLSIWWLSPFLSPTGILDPERETSLDEVLATLELPTQRFQAELRSGGAAEVINLSVNGVRVTLMSTVSSRAERSPDPRESAIFLELAEQVFDRFKPDVLLTYGGHPASLELMRRRRAPKGTFLIVAALCESWRDCRRDAGVEDGCSDRGRSWQ